MADRVASDPQYSLRAFARDLEISASRLSAVLRGKQGLSEASATRLASKLGMEALTAQRFILMVLAADSRSKKRRSEALSLFKQTFNQEQSAPGLTDSRKNSVEKEVKEILLLPLNLDAMMMSNLELALEDFRKSLLSRGIISSEQGVETHLLRVMMIEK